MHTDTALIPLSQGYSAIVDAADHEWLSQWKWKLNPQKNTNYVQRKGPRNHYARDTFMLHRVIMDAPKHLRVDHIDGNGLNNSRSNLRLCTHSENMRNRRADRNSTSKFVGVSLRSDKKKWVAQITTPQMGHIHLGCYSNEEDAARAYDAAARLHFGAFANPNFKD